MNKLKVILLYLILLPAAGKSQIISTYAGNGTFGFYGDGGLATNAEIRNPTGLGLDNSGNLLITDFGFLRKVDKFTNIISTIAGSDTTATYHDSVLAISAFVSTDAVCQDKFGNYYITDGGGLYGIRKIDVGTGFITAYAGNGSLGSSGDGGPATNASFNDPSNVCIDTVNNCLYVADGYNFKIRKIDMVTHIVSTVIGTGTSGYSGDGGPATDALISRVVGLCLDKFGNIYIGDWDNGRIRKLDISSGVISTIAGSGTVGFGGDGGPALNAMFNNPAGICFDTIGNLYFTDQNNQRVRKISVSTGFVSTIAGTGVAGYFGDGGPAASAEFFRPSGICIDRQGNLFVGDYTNTRVRKISSGTVNAYETAKVNNDVIIYPNPTKSALVINSKDDNSNIIITDSNGLVLLLKAGKKEKCEINIGDLQKGIYFVHVNGEVYKFVKE